jgi:hypothetical protein
MGNLSKIVHREATWKTTTCSLPAVNLFMAEATNRITRKEYFLVGTFVLFDAFTRVLDGMILGIDSSICGLQTSSSDAFFFTGVLFFSRALCIIV